MRLFTRIVTVATALALAASLAQAQRGRRPLRAGRMGPDSARRVAIEQRMATLTPEQKARLQAHQEAARAERETVIAKVKSGQLTRTQARAELQAWQKANRPKARGKHARSRT